MRDGSGRARALTPSRTTRAAALATVLFASSVIGACGADPTRSAPGTNDVGPADDPSPPLPLAPASAADLGAVVERVRAAHDLPAMGGAVVTADALVAFGVAGERRAGGPAVTAADRWHIGSNLKAVTAYLAGIAVDARMIDWEDTVAGSFPEMDVEEHYREVTLRDLLSHGGGIPGSPPRGIATAADARGQRDQIVAWALGQPPAAPRGIYHYSNVGYVTAGAMLERAYGTTYEAVIEAALLAPLGVDGYGWGAQSAPGASDAPVPHSLDGGAWIPCGGCDNPPWLSAAGRMHLPLGQWATLVQEMIRADDGDSTLLSAETGALLSSGVIPIGDSGDRYGYGWLVTTRDWAGGRTLTHDGSNTLDHSVAWVSPARDVAFLAVTNAADLDGGRTARALDDLVGRLLEWFEANG